MTATNAPTTTGTRDDRRVASQATEPSGSRVSPRRGPAVAEEIVEAASRLFASHGIRAVSADRILAEVGFSKVTFYRHFPSKDDVVVAYLERELARVRAAIAQGTGAPPDLTTIAAALTVDMCRPGFRGCPFINAAAEYPDAEHPVRRVVADFRAVMVSAIEGWLGSVGVTREGANTAVLAHQIMMLRDGALVAGYLDRDPDAVTRGLADAMGTLLGGRP